MVADILTEGPHTAEFLLSEANFQRSRDEVQIGALTDALLPGQLVEVQPGAIVTQLAGNVGRGTVTGVTLGASPDFGRYTLKLTVAAAGGGTFSVTDPSGAAMADLTVGTPYTSTAFNLTVNAGDIDFAVDDEIYVDLDANTWGKATSGTFDVAILYGGLQPSTEPQRGVVISRDAEVIGSLLVGMTDALLKKLAEAHVIVRD